MAWQPILSVSNTATWKPILSVPSNPSQNTLTTSFPSTAVAGSTSPTDTTGHPDLLGGLVHGIAGSAVSIAQTLPTLPGVPAPPQSYTPSNPVTKALLGTEPITSETQKAAEFANAHPNIPTPLIALGVAASDVLNLAPFGGEKSALEAVTKVKTIAEATQIGRTIGIQEDLLAQFANAAVKTSTTEESKALINSFASLQKTTKAAPALSATDKAIDSSVQYLKNSPGAESAFKLMDAGVYKGIAPTVIEKLHPEDINALKTYADSVFAAKETAARFKGAEAELARLVEDGDTVASKLGVNVNQSTKKVAADIQKVLEGKTEITPTMLKNNFIQDSKTGLFKGSGKPGEPIVNPKQALPKLESVPSSKSTTLMSKAKDAFASIKKEGTRGFVKIGPETNPLESQIPKTEQLPQTESPLGSTSSLPGTVPGEANPVQRLIQALKEAKPIRGQQEKLYSQARAQRVARVAAMQRKTSGERGFFAELSQLKGELPKVDYQSIRHLFGQKEIDSLFNMVKDSPKLDLFEQINARGALLKILGKEGGAVPTVSELKLLNQVFPKEMIDALLANRPLAARLWEGLQNALNVPRSLLSSFDLSAPFRQGVFLVGRKEFYTSFAAMFKQFGSEKAFQAVQEEIAARPTFRLMKQSKLALTEMDRFLTDREEAFMSNWAEKIPVVGSVVKASGRAYVGFLNKLRADTFDSILKMGKNAGVDMKDDKRLADLGKFINSATGRGDLGALNRAGPTLNAVFFSPRLMASRLNILNPVYYVKLDPFVRKQAIKSLLSFTGIAGTTLGLAKMGGASVEVDPRNADFGKIRVGNTRFDVLGGFQQYIRLTSQLLTGKLISSTTGKVTTLGEGYRPLTREEIVIRFFQGKENPIASFITDFLQGQDAVGNKFNLTTEIVNRFVPLIAQDLQDSLKEWGAKGALTAVPATFGVGVQTYTKTPTPAEVAYQKIKDSPTAAADFDKLMQNDPALAKQVAVVKEHKDLGITAKDENTLLLGVANKERAQTVAKEFNALKTKQEKAALWEDYVKKKIITKDVAAQLPEFLK